MTSHVLAKAMRSAIRKLRAPPKEGSGKMSLRELTRQRASLSNIEITEQNIAEFKKVARKYNIDFALKRDNSEVPPKWYVFFKARDTDALTAAFKEFSKKVLEKSEREKNRAKANEKKPSILEKLQKFRAAVAKTPAEKVLKREKDLKWVL